MKNKNQIQLEIRSLYEKVQNKQIPASEAEKKIEELNRQLDTIDMLTDTGVADNDKKGLLTRGVETAYLEKRAITIGDAGLGNYEVVNDVFKQVAKKAPLVGMARMFNGPNATTVIPVISPLTGVATFNNTNWNEPATKGAVAPVRADEPVPSVVPAGVSSLSSVLLQPKPLGAYLGVSYEARTFSSPNYEAQLTSIFAD
jgi:hypothetical protein